MHDSLLRTGIKGLYGHIYIENIIFHFFLQIFLVSMCINSSFYFSWQIESDHSRIIYRMANQGQCNILILMTIKIRIAS